MTLSGDLREVSPPGPRSLLSDPMDVPASDIEQLIANSTRYDLGSASLDPKPVRRLVVITCMDCRIDPIRLLGLARGDAHVLRNAGGVVTDDVIRSLSLSGRKLGTYEIMVIQHTRCGLNGLDEQQFLGDLEAESGKLPPWPVLAFDDVETSVRSSLRILRDSPFIGHDHVRGFIWDVDNGALQEVT